MADEIDGRGVIVELIEQGRRRVAALSREQQSAVAQALGRMMLGD
jgi:DNA-binding MarR family transcriptional regulator